MSGERRQRVQVVRYSLVLNELKNKYISTSKNKFDAIFQFYFGQKYTSEINITSLICSVPKQILEDKFY